MENQNNHENEKDQEHLGSLVKDVCDDYCLNAINRLKALIPENGYDGLADLLMLLEESQRIYLHECSHADKALDEDRVLVLDEILLLAEQHIKSHPDLENIEDMLFGVSGFCIDSRLSEDDLQMLKGILLGDGNLNDNGLKESVIEDVNIPDIISKIPENIREYVALLQMSRQEVEARLNELLPLLAVNISNQDKYISAWEDLQEELKKFASVAEIAGFTGLNQSCEHVLANLIELGNRNFKVSNHQIEIIRSWNEIINAYLNAPIDQEVIQALLIIHCSPDWLSPLGEDKTSLLLVELRALGSAEQVEDELMRQIEATEEDVSLILPDDLPPDLLESLLEELPVLTEEFSQAIQNLSQGGKFEDVTTAQRIAHTVKGAGNTVGVKGIANITHHLEDILMALANAQVLPDKAITQTLVKASDCLQEMSEALINNSEAPVDSLDILQEILDLAVKIDNEGVVNQTNINEQSQQSLDYQQDEPKLDISEESVEQMIRVPVSMIDKLLQFANEMMFMNGQLREGIRKIGTKTRLRQTQLDLLHEVSRDLEELVDIRNYDILKGITESVTSTGFDSLEMDQYNELHTCSRRIQEVATDIREMGLNHKKELQQIDNILMEQSQLNNSSQGDLLTLRMISVQSVVSRFQRSVRQACRLTGKRVNLQITGADVQMDRDILNNMVDPLMHILRNAVDHGIESSSERTHAGKNEIGTIELGFRKEGNMVEIECRDDGAGLNLKAIRNKGIERGIIDANAEISEDELKQLIFQPNFSTSNTVTQVSGRGVGMDVVSSRIRTLGGALKLDSEQAKGCLLKITLPLSLVHYHSLVVKVGLKKIALSERSVEQILHPGAGILNRDGDQLTFNYESNEYPVRTLDSLLTKVKPTNTIPLEQRTVLLVQLQQNKYVVLVEEVIGVKELVVKNLGSFMPNIHGVIGASILDDGSIAPVMDIEELLEAPTRWSELNIDNIGVEEIDDFPCALVVDDSLSARRALEQFVGDLGFTILAARDGQEAIEKLGERVPDIVITDMEMPRLNGIELTEYIRSSEQLRDTPVIMITSRATKKHKLLAQSKGVDVYLTKPYSEDELTETIMQKTNYSNQLQETFTG